MEAKREASWVIRVRLNRGGPMMKRMLSLVMVTCLIGAVCPGCSSGDKDVEASNRVAEDAIVLNEEAEAGVPAVSESGRQKGTDEAEDVAAYPTPAPVTEESRTPRDAAAGDGRPRVAMKTSLGTIVIELYPTEAPATVANFLNYVDKGYYDGLIFHRVIPDFMIQGGGFTPDFKERETGLDAPIENESANGLPNEPGTIAMARTGDPHSATSQFFINVADNAALNHGQTLDGWGYTVFGKVIEGMEVVDAIKDVPTKTSRMNPNEKSQPLDPPMIEKVERVNGEKAE
jgi:cyclophilin family peptidyl-prolyl cis-trans isomerase